MKIIPTFFNPRNPNTDMSVMIGQEKYTNALFIFNDNIHEYFSKTCSAGGGNACLRPYKVGCGTEVENDLKRSWGIPTGPGFRQMTKRIKIIIDYVMNDIRQILIKYKFTKIVYSAESSRGKRGRQTKEGYYLLGSGIFHIGDDVKEYITKAIYTLAGDNLEELNKEDQTEYVSDEEEEEDQDRKQEGNQEEQEDHGQEEEEDQDRKQEGNQEEQEDHSQEEEEPQVNDTTEINDLSSLLPLLPVLPQLEIHPIGKKQKKETSWVTQHNNIYKGLF